METEASGVGRLAHRRRASSAAYRTVWTVHQDLPAAQSFGSHPQESSEIALQPMPGIPVYDELGPDLEAANQTLATGF